MAVTEDFHPGNGVKAVSNALEVLECFRHDEELGVSDIARRLGVAKSTAHRILTTLGERRLLDRNPETGRFRLGLHLVELGLLAGDRMRLRRAATPFLEDLRRITGHTAHLSVAHGSEVVYVERLKPLGGSTLMNTVGRRMPAHCTSSGKAIAAFDPQSAVACVAGGLPALTAASIRTAEHFDASRAEIRRRGVATNIDEAVQGLASVAAPILDSSGRAVAAISVGGPTERILADLDRSGRLVSVAARRLATSLGL